MANTIVAKRTNSSSGSSPYIYLASVNSLSAYSGRDRISIVLPELSNPAQYENFIIASTYVDYVSGARNAGCIAELHFDEYDYCIYNDEDGWNMSSRTYTRLTSSGIEMYLSYRPGNSSEYSYVYAFYNQYPILFILW